MASCHIGPSPCPILRTCQHWLTACWTLHLLHTCRCNSPKYRHPPQIIPGVKVGWPKIYPGYKTGQAISYPPRPDYTPSPSLTPSETSTIRNNRRIHRMDPFLTSTIFDVDYGPCDTLFVAFIATIIILLLTRLCRGDVAGDCRTEVSTIGVKGLQNIRTS